MSAHAPSGQQAVEPWQIVRASMVEQAGDDNPSRVARNILHALHNAGFTVSPTAPSTAAGDLARQYLAIARAYAGHIAVEQHGPNGEAPCTVADLIDSALAAQEGGGERMTGFEGRFEELLDIGLEERRKWIKEMEANGSDVTIADRPLAGLIVALRAALRAAQEGAGNG